MKMGKKIIKPFIPGDVHTCFRVLISIASRNAFMPACVKLFLEPILNLWNLRKIIPIRHRDFLARSTIHYEFSGLNEYSLHLRTESTLKDILTEKYHQKSISPKKQKATATSEYSVVC